MAEENNDETKTIEDSESLTKKNQDIKVEEECTSTETHEDDTNVDSLNSHSEPTSSVYNIPNSNNALVHHKPRKLPTWLKTHNVQSESSHHSSSIPSSSNIMSVTSSQNEFNSPSKRIKVEVVESEVTNENNFDIDLKSSISVEFFPSNTPVKMSTNPDDIGPSTSNVDSSLSVDDVSSSTDIRPICQYGNSCYRQNSMHRKEYYHPTDTDVEENMKIKKPNCWYGPSCYRKNEDHLRKFNHDFPKRKSKKVIDQPLATSSIDDEDDEDTDYDDPFSCNFSSDEFEPSFDSGSETDFEIDEEDEDEEDNKKMLKEARKFTKNWK